MDYKDKVEDTFFESMNGKYIRALITAEDWDTVRNAAYDSTATPSAVIGRVEAGVESFVNPNATPDGRPGAICQYWFGLDNIEKFEVELSYRIRQDILVKPFTKMFNVTNNPEGYIEMMKNVGHCGDGFEWEINEYNRDMINVPIAVPDFQIESKFGYSNGIMGGNYWYFCETKEAVLEAGKLIMDEIMDVPGVIAPFGVCSAASKPETNYPWIGPTSNHPYCPSLKDKLGEESKVPDGVNYIPEIVLNSVNQKQLNLAIKNSVDAILEVPGVLRISAGNFGGKLGDNTTNLLDILK